MSNPSINVILPIGLPTAHATPVAPAFVDERQENGRVSLSLPKNVPRDLTEGRIGELKTQGFTTGLAKALSSNGYAFPIRYWVVDNSGSMHKPDGHRIIETATHNNINIAPCTRWEEIKACVNYHTQMSALLHAPTVFRLLNNPGTRAGAQQFSIADRGIDLVQHDIQAARSIMNKVNPSGFTPLTEHILAIHETIRDIAPTLQREGQKAVIVLATDGTPTDEQGYSSEYASKQFLSALRLLEGLPVWIVIRLCTDDDEVVNYYNDLDDQLELSLEVLDDFVAEAHEVCEHNPWLNYGLPLHRIRELGFHDRVFDLIDERALTKSEVRQMCVLLFGEDKFDAVPDPSVDWLGFLNEVEGMIKKETGQWNPVKKRVLPWIDARALNRAYGSSSCGGCVIL